MADTVVLIIDSDETNSLLLTQLLRKMGYMVVSSPNARDGLMRINDFLPGAIICDTALPDMNPRELIQRFQEDRRLALSPVIAVSGRFNADEMEACLKAGFTEYYAKSGTAALALADALPGLIADRAAQAKDDRGLLIVFASAKGGIGTSSLCANIAHTIGVTMQPSTVGLMDLVLPMGSITSITGYEGPCRLGDMVQRMDAGLPLTGLKECMPVPHGWNFHYLPGSPDPEVASRMPLNRLPDIMKAMRGMFNYTVVDIGRMLSPIILPILQEADVLVLVIGADNNSTELSSRLLKFLISKGIRPERIFPILNRAVGLQGLTKSEIEATLGIEVRVTVPYLMDNFTLANNMHVPFISKYPETSASMELKQIAGDISRLAIHYRTTESKTSP